ncbi:Enterobactin exporter EntS [Streptomyces sp. RB5]|uniref:Enterobactin exporter EntS n=1 Tax=Streptomyces smaragdinus TaxID=2585196 RepID=A0A7K0CC17_9ACTN|nr:MFS transporter [Streptomyces smaragdinus]MQY10997.1 Enterobactin exporter EntS [Streptomyces smaragdinus]
MDESPADANRPAGSAPDTAVAEAAAASVPLRRNRRFQALWIGGAASVMSFNIAVVAIPLIVLATTGSTVAAGVYGFVDGAAAFLATTPAGTLLDRYNRRVLLVGSELLRALAFSVVLVGLWTDTLGMPLLVVTAAVSGAVRPLGAGARMLATRSVVPEEQLTSALTQEEVRSHGASVVGPGLAGVLYSVARSVPVAGIVIGYLISALCGLATPDDRGAERRRAQPSGGTFSGLAHLLRTPVLRAAIIALGLLNLGGAALDLIVIVLIQDGGGSATDVGWAFALASIGGLAGAGLVGPLHKALLPGRLLIAICLWAGALTCAFAVALGPWWYGAVLALAVLPLPAVSVLIDILVFRQVSDAMRGRTITATMTLLTIGPSLGPLLAGFLLRYTSPVTASLVVAGIFALAGLSALGQRVVRRAEWPRPQASDDAEAAKV